MASCWIPQLLALEVSTATRQAQGASRSSAADPRDQPGKSPLGRSSHPWRTPQARHRCRARPRLPSTWPDAGAHHRRAGERSSGTMQMGSPRSIFSWFRRSPSGCYTDCWSSDTIEGASCGSAYGAPECRMDRPAVHGGMWLGERPHYLIRDRDRVYGEAFTRRVRAMGRDRPTAPRSPWENGHAERLIGSIRRECLDHVIVFGERHLRHVLGACSIWRRAPATIRIDGARRGPRWQGLCAERQSFGKACRPHENPGDGKRRRGRSAL